MSMNPPLTELPPRVTGRLKCNWEDLTGKRFGRLTCVYYVGHCKWLCKCDCGDNVFKVVAKVALRHAIESCGCLARERSAERARKQSTKHGLVGCPEYAIWHSLRQRCNNPNNPGWRLYGGRGIKVSKEWGTFEQFYSDMGPRPSGRHQLDRANSNAGYSKANCRWVTPDVQANNTSRNRFVEFGGERLTVGQWATKLGINYGTLHGRIHRGWSPKAALSLPLQHGKHGPC